MSREALYALQVVTEASSLAQLVMIAVSALIVLAPSPDARRPGRGAVRLLLEGVAFLAALLLLDWLLMVLSMRFRFMMGWNFSLAVLLALALFAATACPYGARAKLVMTAVLFSTIVAMMEWSGPNATRWLGGASGQRARVFISVLSDALIVFSAALIRRLSVASFEISVSHLALGLACALAATFLSVFHQALAPAWMDALPDTARVFIWTTFLLMDLVDMLAYVFSYQTLKNQKRLLDLQLMAKKREAEAELASLSEENLHDLRALRHDLRNQCLYMRTMLDQGRYDDLKEYFEQFTGKFNHQLFGCMDSGNRQVDAILNLERSRAAQRGVTVNANIVVPPALTMEGSDLCSLLMNLLDNAIEECLRVNAARTVNVVMQSPTASTLFISVVNPTDRLGTENDMRTRKKDQRLHGYGLDIIRGVVKSYGGHFRYRVEDGRFVAEVLLNLTEPKEENAP